MGRRSEIEILAMARTYDFPPDMLAAREELHRVAAALTELLQSLPWSVECLFSILGWVPSLPWTEKRRFGFLLESLARRAEGVAASRSATLNSEYGQAA